MPFPVGHDPDEARAQAAKSAYEAYAVSLSTDHVSVPFHTWATLPDAQRRAWFAVIDARGVPQPVQPPPAPAPHPASPARP